MYTGSQIVLTALKVDALYECCNAFYKERGDDARCVTCPKPDLLRWDVRMISLAIC